MSLPKTLIIGGIVLNEYDHSGVWNWNPSQSRYISEKVYGPEVANLRFEDEINWAPEGKPTTNLWTFSFDAEFLIAGQCEPGQSPTQVAEWFLVDASPVSNALPSRVKAVTRWRFRVGKKIREVDVGTNQVVHVSPSGELSAHDTIGGGGIISLPRLPGVSFEESQRIVAEGSVAEVTVKDRVSDRHTNPIYVKDYLLFLDVDAHAIFSSNTPAASVSNSGKVVHEEVGKATIKIEIPEHEISLLWEKELQEYHSSVDVFKGFVEGSAAKNATEAIDSRIAGKDRNSARKLYASYPSNSNFTDPLEIRGGVDEFIRNTGFWGSDLDLTCISPSVVWKDQTLHRRAPSATAISPWHWISCHHGSFHPPLDSRVYFVGMGNQVDYRTTLAKKQVGGTDLHIGLFDAELPAWVTPARILPNDVFSYISLFRNFPCLLLDQQQHGLIHDSLAMSEYVNSFTYPSEASKRYEFVDQIEDNRNVKGEWTGIEYYDSGSPSFVILNNQLVILTVWTSGRGGSGNSIWGHAGAVQTAMNELSIANSKPTPTLSRIDLSNFNQY